MKKASLLALLVLLAPALAQAGAGALGPGAMPQDVAITASANNKLYAVAPPGLSAATASTDNPMILLVNLSTNTVTARLVGRTFGCDVTNIQVTYRLFIDPVVVSSGTPITPVKMYQTGIPDSKMQIFTLPTVSSSGSSIESLSNGQNSGAIHIEDGQLVSVSPGHRLLITANPSSNNRAQLISLKWLEE